MSAENKVSETNEVPGTMEDVKVIENGNIGKVASGITPELAEALGKTSPVIPENIEINIEEQLLLLSAHKTIQVKKDKVNFAVEVIVNQNLIDFDKIRPDQAYTEEEKEQYAQSIKREFYRDYLKNHFENLVILTGAGSSVGFGGLLMSQLWDEVKENLGKATFEAFCREVGYLSEAESIEKCDKNLEKLLSKANLAKEFIAGSAVSIEDIIIACEKVIYKKCKIDLPDNSPHESFLNKLTNRKLKDPRVKIFTLNYDTLFEQAAIKGNFTVIDGFSFSFPRTLSGRNFDYDIIHREKSRIKEEESFVAKVFHLYKPHGSVNWEFGADGESVVINQTPKKPLMIFPKDSKYESSYEQPFFEMMARFQQNLRKDNTLLICIGFSFNDKHVITAIKEAVSQNPSFRLLIINKSIVEKGGLEWFIDRARVQHNVSIIAEDFNNFVHNYPSSQLYSDNLSVRP